MANLSKLDETIDQLEAQAEILKQNNKVLTKVAEVSVAIEKAVNELSLGNKNLDTVKKEVQSSLKVLKESISNIEKQNEKHIDSLITSNKSFLRELSEDVSSKLSRFSSDIQVSIRQERTQLQEALQNNITNQFNSLESKQKELFVQHGKQISLVKALLFVVLAFCLGILIKLFLG